MIGTLRIAENHQKHDEKSGKFFLENAPLSATMAGRFTENEQVRITQSAALRGMSVSQYIRYCAMIVDWDEMQDRMKAETWNKNHPVV